jgi:hypothetical protein
MSLVGKPEESPEDFELDRSDPFFVRLPVDKEPIFG